MAFGRDGEEVLNELEKEAGQRAVERSVGANSLTAERRAVQERPEYGGTIHNDGGLGGVAHGMMFDVATGTWGLASAVGASKSTLNALRNSVNKNRIEETVKGTADLLSRQAKHGRDTAVDVLSKIDGSLSRNVNKAPVNYGDVRSIAKRAATPAAIQPVKRLKALVDDFRGVEK
jgi:hypothetical protein